MNLELDFVRRRALIGAPGAALLVAGVLAAGLSAEQYFTVTAELAARARPVVAERASARSTPANLEQLRARLLAANQILEKRTAPWDALFRDIEAVSDKKIGLLSVQPDLPGRQVRIGGEAQDAAALAGYITRLEEKASLGSVLLTDHELRQEQGRTVIRFSLIAVWTAEPA
jgi:hypothetical protein